MTRANLIPERRRETRRRLSRVRKWAVALGAYAVSLICVYSACFAFDRDDGGAISKEMSRTTTRFRASGEQIDELRASVAEASQQLTAARSLAQNPDWSLLLAMVARDRGDEVVLDRCSLAPVDSGVVDASPAAGQVIYQRYLLDLSGFGRSQTSVSQFVLRLEKSRLFESVRLISTRKREFIGDQAVSFRLECALSGRGGE